MRWSLPFLLLAAWTVGCLDEVQGVTPVVLVESSYEVAGEGQTSRLFVPPCDMARYGRDPAEVTLHRAPQEGLRPSFIVLHDLGDSWRAANRSAAPGGHVLAAVASGGGGPISWLGGGSISALGFASAFPEGAREGRSVAWDGDQARYEDRTLRPGVPVERTFEFDVPADEGGALRVRETLRVTYLGKVPVFFEERPCP